MKTCPQCQSAKPLTEFHVRKSRGGQPASRCKTCSREAQRTWRSKQTDRQGIAENDGPMTTALYAALIERAEQLERK